MNTDIFNNLQRSLQINLSPLEFQLILQALAELPYKQVYELMHHLQQQVGPQLVALQQLGANGESPSKVNANS